MILQRKSKTTLTPFELNHGDTLHYLKHDGNAWEMTLISTSAAVLARDHAALRGYKDGGHDGGDISSYAFECELKINGTPIHIHREVGTQASFYEPLSVDGVDVWFDAASCAFTHNGGFMTEKDWRSGLICEPGRKARFVIQDSGKPICPEPLYPWFAGFKGTININDCYCGEDCWMGPYNGGAAHCGLDINMPAGTVLAAPIRCDDHYLFNSVAAGSNNNRWRGIRRWPDGSEWWLQSHHLVGMLVPERTPLEHGVPYATTAGVWVGRHEHTHFLFRVIEQGGDYLIDPWIVFSRMMKPSGA